MATEVGQTETIVEDTEVSQAEQDRLALIEELKKKEEADRQQLIADLKEEEKEGDGWAQTLDIMRGAARGPVNAFKEGAKTLGMAFGQEYDEVETPFANNLLDLLGEQETTTGEVVEGFSRFISSWVLLRGYGGATTKTGKILETTTKGAVIDFTIWNQDDGRLANVLADAGMDNAIVNYLKTDPSDSAAEDKFKHALEGGGLSLTLEAIVGIVKGYKSVKDKIWNNAKSPEDAVAQIDDLAANDRIIPKPPKQTGTPTEDYVPEVKTQPKKEVEISPIEITQTEFKGTKPPETALNYDRVVFESAEEQKIAQTIFENILNSKEAIAYTKSGKIPLAITEKQAAELRRKLGDDIMPFAKTSVAKTRGQEVALTLLRKEYWARFQKIKDTIKESDPDDVVAILNTMKELPELDLLVRASKSIQTSAARTTSAGRIDVIPEDAAKFLEEVQQLAAKDFDQASKKIVDKTTAKRIHKKLKEFANTDSAMNLNRLMKDLSKDDAWWKKTGRVLTEMRTSGLLSSPVTLMKNVLGNYSVRKINQLEYRMAGVISKMKGLEDGLQKDEIEALTNSNWHLSNMALENWVNALKQIPKGSAVEYRAALENAKKIGMEFGEQSKQYQDAITAANKVKPYEDVLEEGFLDFYQKFDTPSYRAISSDYLMKSTDGIIRQNVAKTLDAAGALIRTPYQALGITDDMFKRAIYGSELKYIATREANILKLQGIAKQKYIEEFYEAHNTLFQKGKSADLTPREKGLIKKYVTANKGKFHREAIERSREGTFQEEIKATEFTDTYNVDKGFNINPALASVDNTIKKFPGGQWLVPFYRTPVNIVKFVGRRTPGLHKLSTKMRDDIAAGGRRKAIAEARLTMGTMLYSMFGLYAYNGFITGTAPGNERNTWKAAGIQENAMYIPVLDQWIPISGLDPIAMFAGLSAEINMFVTDMNRRGWDTDSLPGFAEDLGELQGAMITALSNQILSKTWLEGLDQFQKMWKGEAPQYLGQQAATFLPFSSLANFMNSEQGESIKEAKGVWENITKKYAPYLNRPALDIFGKEQDLVSFLGMPQLVPTTEIGRQELMRLKVNQLPMSDKIVHKSSEIELEAEDHWKLRELLNSHVDLEGRLNYLVDSASYQAMPDGVDYDVPGTKKYEIGQLFSNAKAAAKKEFLNRYSDRLDELLAEVEKNRASVDNQNKVLYMKWFENTPISP